MAKSKNYSLHYVVSHARKGNKVVKFGDKIYFRKKWYIVRNSLHKGAESCDLCAFSEEKPFNNPCKACVDGLLVPIFGFLTECDESPKNESFGLTVS